MLTLTSVPYGAILESKIFSSLLGPLIISKVGLTGREAVPLRAQVETDTFRNLALTNSASDFGKMQTTA